MKGCRSDFEQTEPGRFRASFPAPNEYHLTFTAGGYHDAEAYTPKVTELKTIEGIVARMKRKTDGSAAADRSADDCRQRDAEWPAGPIRLGCSLGLAAAEERAQLAGHARAHGRGRADRPCQFPDPRRVLQSQRSVPERGLVRRRRGSGPSAHADRADCDRLERKEVARHCLYRGGLHPRSGQGRAPRDWEGHLWVVAFSKTAIREESRAAPDGTFSFPALPPGEYGLKVGHDAYDDPEVYPGSLMRDHPEAFKENADPWKRAKIVSVRAGQTTEGVEVELPQ